MYVCIHMMIMYGYSVAPYATAYRSILRNSRIRRTTQRGGTSARPSQILSNFDRFCSSL